MTYELRRAEDGGGEHATFWLRVLVVAPIPPLVSRGVQTCYNNSELCAFKFCGYDLVQYDYDGLSNTVLAERSPPYVRDAYSHLLYTFTGDRFVSTYLRGPLGVIARTAEKGNADTSDNETHYYLADLMGNHVATVRDAGEGGDSSPSWQAFDAFGAALGKSGGVAGSLGWRGGEGSVSDRETGLVYMQSRHYDPSLGRFVQADALPLASLTTQGANRYIYCENDPVNRSDPTGRTMGEDVDMILAGLFFSSVTVSLFFGFGLAGSLLVPILGALALGFLLGALIAILAPCFLGFVAEKLVTINWRNVLLATGIGIVVGILAAFLLSPLAGVVIGGIVDLVLNVLLARKEEDSVDDDCSPSREHGNQGLAKGIERRHLRLIMRAC